MYSLFAFQIKLFGDKKILSWIREKAENCNLLFIRMDTWANNPVIIDYYKSFGFEIVDYFTTPNSKDLPIQKRNNAIILLELSV